MHQNVYAPYLGLQFPALLCTRPDPNHLILIECTSFEFVALFERFFFFKSLRFYCLLQKRCCVIVCYQAVFFFLCMPTWFIDNSAQLSCLSSHIPVFCCFELFSVWAQFSDYYTSVWLALRSVPLWLLTIWSMLLAYTLHTQVRMQPRLNPITARLLLIPISSIFRALIWCCLPSIFLERSIHFKGMTFRFLKAKLTAIRLWRVHRIIVGNICLRKCQ